MSEPTSDPKPKKASQPRETLGIRLSADATAAVRKIAARFAMTQSDVLAILEAALDEPARAVLAEIFAEKKAAQDAEGLFS